MSTLSTARLASTTSQTQVKEFEEEVAVKLKSAPTGLYGPLSLAVPLRTRLPAPVPNWSAAAVIVTPAWMLLKVTFRRVPKSANPAPPGAAPIAPGKLEL